MSCPQCGRETTQKFCSPRCGLLWRQAHEKPLSPHDTSRGNDRWQRALEDRAARQPRRKA
jgi:hypothetical protein